jgi:DNA-damage-inducible protein D
VNQIEPAQKAFESIKKLSADGYEYWSAREISKLLEYSEYRNFQPAIEKAVEACKNSNQGVEDHFVESHEMVQIGSSALRKVDDIHLSRYGCYLIVQNADPTKEMVALGQTYFAIQTRRQELTELSEYQNLKSEDEKRIFLRNQLKSHNKQLAEAARHAGVETPLDYAIFQDHGYKGLYGGLGAKDIQKKKELKKSQQILDHMGSTELAANLFRATQTEEKIRRENISGKKDANHTHFEVGKKVRQTIQDIGGTMPENLPVEDSILKLDRQNKRHLND